MLSLYLSFSPSQLRLASPLRKLFYFSPDNSDTNTGYNLLELVIEDVTGQDFDAFKKRQVFKPAGLTHSTFNWSDTLQPPVATGYGQDGTYTLGLENLLGGDRLNPVCIPLAGRPPCCWMVVEGEGAFCASAAAFWDGAFCKWFSLY